MTQCTPLRKTVNPITHIFDRRNDDGQICKFPLSIPGLGIEFRLRRNREIRVLLPWIHLHFVKHFPCGFAGGFAFIAGTTAINAQISPCNLRSGGCIPASPEPGKFAGCSPGYTCISLNVPPAKSRLILSVQLISLNISPVVSQGDLHLSPERRR